MARLAAQPNVKSLFNSEAGVPSPGSGSDPKDQFSSCMMFKRPTRLYASSSSSSSKKTKRVNAEVRLFVGDEIADRDNFTCQYCSSREYLTIDHVMPISRGGEWKWDNLVTACAKCNSKKGQKTVEESCMKLMKIPRLQKTMTYLPYPSQMQQ